jgi:hypothetical protein
VEALERPQVAEIEDRPEVDVEALEPLPGEHRAPAANLMHRLRGEGLVVGRRRRADVARGARQTAREQLPLSILDARDRVELPPVPVRAVDRVDRAGVVEERVRVADPGLELELVGDVGPAVARLIDVDVVADVVAELEEVRPAERRLEQQVVGDPRDGARIIGADERVGVITEISPFRGLRTYATMGSFPAPSARASACSAASAPITVTPAAAPAELFTNPRLVTSLMGASL